MISNMKKFKKTVLNLDDNLFKDNWLFSQTRDFYQAHYVPTFVDASLYREITIEWNDVHNSLKITDNGLSGEKRTLFYFADEKNRIVHPDLKKTVPNIQVLLDQLIDGRDFQVNEDLLHIDSNIFGHILYEIISAGHNKTNDDIGDGIKKLVSECKTKDQYDFVNKTVEAISGCSLEDILEESLKIEAEVDRYF